MTKQVKRLTAKQQQAISLLLSCKNNTAVAQELGVAGQTVNIWKNKNQDFATELDRQQQELNQENQLQQAGLVDQSIQVWRQGLKSENERLRQLTAVHAESAYHIDRWYSVNFNRKWSRATTQYQVCHPDTSVQNGKARDRQGYKCSQVIAILSSEILPSIH